ncbi:MAG: VWA domain-containing protein [Pseudomonadota bacterium]
MFAHARKFIAAAGVAALAALPAAAEEDVILVLDGSGSMWGQIEGEPKIAIAREVTGQVLDEMPDDRRLGLVAYGHNRKGDCSDIETIAEVGADRTAIREAVNALNPKGKTPLSASVQYAAEQLRYTENKATVILVSDGEETCDLDPCAVGTALEEAGVDFTAHVIGFDIAEETQRAQLQCLAENTGGIYLNASSAEELSDALEQTVVEAPEAGPTRLTLRATDLQSGPLIEAGLNWTVRQAGGGEVLFTQEDAGPTEAELPPGVYDVLVAHPAEDLSGEARNVELKLDQERTVTIALEYDLEATVRTVPEEEGPVSSEIIVYWTGPDREGDYVTVVEADASPGGYRDYEYTRDGNPLKLRLPPDAGEYEVRYVLSRPTRVLASVAIAATEVGASLDAVDTIAAGSPFEVTWNGPAYDDDWITVVKPDAGERAYTDYEYTRQGNPLTLKAPLEAGDYEVRYVQAGDKVIARRPITVTAVEAAISGPETAPAGSYHQIEWAGPGTDRDWITVVKPSAGERAYTDYEYTRKGNPLELKMPLEPGNYEFRYVQEGRKILARQPIVISPVEATLTAPETVDAGAAVDVSWTGPGERRDWITVVEPSARENAYTDYEYAREGAVLSIKSPLEPGEYEYRYVLDGKRVIARRPVTVRDVSATLSAPSSVAAEARFTVEWDGPANQRDFITVAAPDARENAYTDYEYARNGSPLELKAPAEPGDYELRFVLDGKRVIARRPITVN